MKLVRGMFGMSHFLSWVVIGMMAMSLVSQAQDKCPPCPSNPSIGASDPNCPKDPAFVLSDPVPKLSLIAAQAALGQTTAQVPAELSEKETKLIERLEVVIQGKPEETMPRVLDIWKDGYSKDCKRMAILSGMKTVKSTDDQAMLKFMLDALVDPQTQKTEIGRLGRGNSLEKLVAAKRMAVFLQNPQLAKL